MRKHTRRSALQIGLRTLGLAAAGSLTQRKGRAAGSTGETLICIELAGGADSNSLLVPMDGPAYNDYVVSRGEFALPASSLLPINSLRQKAAFGFPKQAAELAGLYQQRALAVVANVGDLPQPTTKAGFLANPGAVPREVFQPSGNGKMLYLPNGFQAPAWSGAALNPGSEVSPEQILTFDGISVIAQHPHARAGHGSATPALVEAVRSMNVRTAFPPTVIGSQLQMAVKIAAAGPAAGAGRQIVTVTMPGFSAGAPDGLGGAVSLYSDLGKALAAFHQATFELGVASTTTAFTWSEYNRALEPNERHRADAGWGGHQLVVGASVAGGEIYGTFPSLRLGSPDDINGRGVLLPSTSTAQFAATHARWLGLAAGERQTAFPTLRLFRSEDVGFYGEA